MERFGVGQFSAEVLEHGIVGVVAQGVKLDRERALGFIGNQVS